MQSNHRLSGQREEFNIPRPTCPSLYSSRPSSSSSSRSEYNPYPIIQPATSSVFIDAFPLTSTLIAPPLVSRESTSEHPAVQALNTRALPAPPPPFLSSPERKTRQRTPTKRQNEQAHIESEKKRREDINQGFEQIRALVPGCTATDSKSTVLSRTVGHIGQLQEFTTALGYDPRALPDLDSIRASESRESSNNASSSSFSDSPAVDEEQQRRRNSIAYLLNTPTWTGPRPL